MRPEILFAYAGHRCCGPGQPDQGKDFSDDRVLAYTTAQSISMGYSENDFQQFMDQHADLAFQCLSAEFMATGNTPFDEESLAEVVGGSRLLMISGFFEKAQKDFGSH